MASGAGPAEVAAGFLWQVALEGSIEVPRYSPAVAALRDAIAEDGTISRPRYPAVVFPTPLACGRCPGTRRQLAQGRWGEEITVVCTGCARIWTPQWDGDWRLGADPAEFNRMLLREAITGAAPNGPSLSALAVVTALHDALTEGTWTPTRDDRGFGFALREWQGDQVTARSLALLMGTGPSRFRTPGLVEGLARSVGAMHALPDGTADLADAVRSVLHRIDRIDPADLSLRPQARV
jgi:hypothetical protein